MQRTIGLLLLAVQASAWPTPDKYKPLIEACIGQATQSNCTANIQGVCQTTEHGARICAHGCDHHHKGPFFKALMKLKDHVFKHKHEEHHHEWMHQAGDCDDSKKDGEACTAPSAGQCIPTGKCPVFKGQTVCRPNDAHPPKFVTDACKGKAAGDDCAMMFMKGKCEKIKYFSDLTCKVAWPHFGKWHEHKKEKPEIEEEAIVV